MVEVFSLHRKDSESMPATCHGLEGRRYRPKTPHSILAFPFSWSFLTLRLVNPGSLLYDVTTPLTTRVLGESSAFSHFCFPYLLIEGAGVPGQLISELLMRLAGPAITASLL